LAEFLVELEIVDSISYETVRQTQKKFFSRFTIVPCMCSATPTPVVRCRGDVLFAACSVRVRLFAFARRGACGPWHAPPRTPSRLQPLSQGLFTESYRPKNDLTGGAPATGTSSSMDQSRTGALARQSHRRAVPLSPQA